MQTQHESCDHRQQIMQPDLASLVAFLELLRIKIRRCHFTLVYCALKLRYYSVNVRTSQGNLLAAGECSYHRVLRSPTPVIFYWTETKSKLADATEITAHVSVKDDRVGLLSMISHHRRQTHYLLSVTWVSDEQFFPLCSCYPRRLCRSA